MMNERIKKLAEQVFSFKYKSDPDKLNEGHHMGHIQQFAELIVRECMREIHQKSFELLDIDFYPHYLERLKKHFGVER